MISAFPPLILVIPCTAFLLPIPGRDVYFPPTANLNNYPPPTGHKHKYHPTRYMGIYGIIGPLIGVGVCESRQLIELTLFHNEQNRTRFRQSIQTSCL